mgnify:FL=1
MITLELAKQLKELGFPQDTLIGYCDLDWHKAEDDLIDPDDYNFYHHTMCFRSKCISEFGEQGFIAVPTVEELIKEIGAFEIKQLIGYRSIHYFVGDELKHYYQEIDIETDEQFDDLCEIIIKIWIEQHEYSITK